MKIEEIKTYVVDAGRRNFVFVEVLTDEGITGIGEATMFRYARTMEALIKDVKRYLIGQNPLEIEKIMNLLKREGNWRGSLISTAISGIEIALWDIKGKKLGVPVYELLGGPVRDKVKIYANHWFWGCKTVDDYANKALETVESGYDALKWSPFGPAYYNLSPEEEKIAIKCVESVRKAVGDRVALLIEAHGRFNLPTATRIINAFEKFDPFFIEEPIPQGNIDSYVELKHNVKVPIATGERLYDMEQFKELISKYAVNYIQPDTVHCGGILATKEIADFAGIHNIPVVPHNPNGPVSTAAMVHFAASSNYFSILEYVAIDVPYRDEMLLEPLEIDNGYIKLPKKPGLGIELNKDLISQHPYVEKSLDHFSKKRIIKI